MQKHQCPKCKSEKIDLASRIVGYFSKITNWSKSKVEELKHREKGNYSLQEKK